MPEPTPITDDDVIQQAPITELPALHGPLTLAERGLTLEGFGEPLVAARRWFVLHTKPRQEKALAEFLRAATIAYYIPLQRTIKFYGARQATINQPLFPGYVFLRGSVEEAWAADRTRRVVSIIRVDDQDRLGNELRNVELALASGAPLDPYPYLRDGVRAEVRSGPLKGLQGVIDGRSKTDRLILKVDMLGRALTVDIHGALLEPLQ